jgi:aryl-alcohol dehydrogenase-like predicted oxidoreductase
MEAARDYGLIAGIGLLLQLAPNVLLIPGTGSVAHLRQNLAAEGVRLDEEALRKLDGVTGWDRASRGRAGGGR